MLSGTLDHLLIHRRPVAADIAAQADMNDDGKLSEEEFVDFFVDHIIVNGFESARSA